MCDKVSLHVSLLYNTCRDATSTVIARARASYSSYVTIESAKKKRRFFSRHSSAET